MYNFDDSANADTLAESLDISSKVSTSAEFGLSGLAIHPEFPNDNRIFLLYNDSTNGNRSTISSFTVDTSDFTVNAVSEIPLLTLDQNSGNHNGGDLHFGTGGLLYASFGDDQDQDQAQDRTDLRGALIRIDISTAPYSIPTDNPFNAGQSLCDSSANSAGQICPEIYAYGFRNPWRFSIDPLTGTPWVGDVGEDTLEEVDRIISGGNYGWPTMEGNICTSGPCNPDDFESPITTYGRSFGVSVMGGYVHRASETSSLYGQYIFGDVFLSRFFSVAADASVNTAFTEIFSAGTTIYSMAQGNDGEVYLLKVSPSGDGDMILRVTDGNTITNSMPASLNDTGCFNTQTKTSAQGVFEYTNINPLGSDSATKFRSFAIPDGTEIEVLDDGEFRFPTNSVLLKHFLNDTTYLETRLLVKHESGWQGYSYEWNDAQTDADLLSDGKTKDVGDFVHTYPNQGQCNLCHIGNDASLGIETLQLNRDYSPIGMNIVDYLSAANYFTTTQSSGSHETLYALDDSSATLEQRARSYLHSNCSGCHRPDTGNRVPMDLRFTTAFSETNTCDIDASLDDLGVTNAKRIAPGNADASVILLRMETLDTAHRMPPLASLIVDTEATTLVRNWINSLSNCDD